MKAIETKIIFGSDLNADDEKPYAEIDGIDSYLVRAVVNTCIDRIRKRDRVSELVSDVISESRIESFDDREIVRYAISRLPERQRIAVHLKDIEGYTTEEVACMLLKRFRFSFKFFITKERRNEYF